VRQFIFPGLLEIHSAVHRFLNDVIQPAAQSGYRSHSRERGKGIYSRNGLRPGELILATSVLSSDKVVSTIIMGLRSMLSPSLPHKLLPLLLVI
jgi:hypothetical protein